MPRRNSASLDPTRGVPTVIESTATRTRERRRSADTAAVITERQQLEAQTAVERATRDANARLAAAGLDPEEIAAIGRGRS
jgi:hypothetical protein